MDHRCIPTQDPNFTFASTGPLSGPDSLNSHHPPRSLLTHAYSIRSRSTTIAGAQTSTLCHLRRLRRFGECSIPSSRGPACVLPVLLRRSAGQQQVGTSD